MKIRKIISWAVNEFFGQITHFGGLFFYLVLILFVFSLEEYALGTTLIVSLALIMIIGLLIKALFWKQRPKKQKYTNVLEKVDASSFPSIHAARASSLAVIMHAFFGSLPSTVFFVFFALLVSYSRIYLKKHYLIDVLGGLVLGALSGFFAIALLSL